jgi:hypothetical protein
MLIPLPAKERLPPWEAWAEISELIWDIISLRRMSGGYAPDLDATTEGNELEQPPFYR